MRVPLDERRPEAEGDDLHGPWNANLSKYSALVELARLADKSIDPQHNAFAPPDCSAAPAQLSGWQQAEFDESLARKSVCASDDVVTNTVPTNVTADYEQQCRDYPDAGDPPSYGAAEAPLSGYQHAECDDSLARKSIYASDDVVAETTSTDVNVDYEQQCYDYPDVIDHHDVGALDEGGGRHRRPLAVLAGILIISGLAGLTTSVMSWREPSNEVENESAKLESTSTHDTAHEISIPNSSLPTEAAVVTGAQLKDASQAKEQPLAPKFEPSSVPTAAESPQPAENTPPTIALGGGKNEPVSESPVVPATSAQNQLKAEATLAPAPTEVRKVKVVSVRPDGTMVPDNAEPRAATTTEERPPASQPPAPSPTSAQRSAKSDGAVDSPATPAKQSHQNHSMRIVQKAKSRAATRVVDVQPRRVASSPQEPQPASSGPFAAIEGVASSLAGALKNLTGSP
jgi:hypothetical protein